MAKLPKGSPSSSSSKWPIPSPSSIKPQSLSPKSGQGSSVNGDKHQTNGSMNKGIADALAKRF